jgi:hypothetical protein
MCYRIWEVNYFIEFRLELEQDLCFIEEEGYFNWVHEWDRCLLIGVIMDSLVVCVVSFVDRRRLV